jgi:voltage-gated potassium channel
MNRLVFKIFHFCKLVWNLVTGVPFLTLSFFGNTIVFFFAGIMYYIEKDVNPKMANFIDAVWWSFSTTSTVGYGDVVPITTLGKIIGILLMLIGVAIFAIYTALFARAIIDDKHYMEYQ